MSGTVNIARSLFYDAAFKDQPFTEREAFMWLVMEASWKDREKRIDNRIISLKRGQLAASVRFMAEAWGWQKSTVDRFLQRLKNRDMIGTDSGTGVNVITICKYSHYQGGSDDCGTAKIEKRDSSGTAAGQTRIPDVIPDANGGGGIAREAENPTFRERILSSCSVDPVSGLTGHGGRQIGTQADMAEANRWLQLPGITEATAIEEITRLMAGKRDGPPKSFAYFTSAMQRLSGALSAPDLQPTTPAQRGPANDRRSEQRAFGAAIHQLADGLSSGAVRLDVASRNPWGQ